MIVLYVFIHAMEIVETEYVTVFVIIISHTVVEQNILAYVNCYLLLYDATLKQLFPFQTPEYYGN